MTLDRDHPAVRYYIFLLKFAGNTRFEIDWRLELVNNLCQFVRALFFRSLCLAVVIVVAIAALCGLFALIYFKPFEVGIVVGVSGVLFAISAAIVFGGAAIINLVRYRPRKRRKSKPSIIFAYIEAAHRGICPLLTITHDK